MNKMEIVKVLINNIGSIAESIIFRNSDENMEGKIIVISEYGYVSIIEEDVYKLDKDGEFPREFISVFRHKQFSNQYQVVMHISRMIEDLKKEIKKEVDAL